MKNCKIETEKGHMEVTVKEDRATVTLYQAGGMSKGKKLSLEFDAEALDSGLAVHRPEGPPGAKPSKSTDRSTF